MNENVVFLATSEKPRRSAGAHVIHSIRRGFRRFVIRFVAPISRHPAMTLATGFGLFLSGSVELAEQVFTDFDTMIGLHQGVILLGIVTFLRGLADIVEASEWLSKGADEEEAARA